MLLPFGHIVGVRHATLTHRGRKKENYKMKRAWSHWNTIKNQLYNVLFSLISLEKGQEETLYRFAWILYDDNFFLPVSKSQGENDIFIAMAHYE